jgi:catechol 2,3-dioxygenase-like lactoylglutathione lyase family enzyme
VQGLSHIGFLVPDLDAATESYGHELGLDFVGPTAVHIPRCVDDAGDGPLDVRIAMSRQGPPYVELMEQVGRGFYSATRPVGFNHVAVWARDVDIAAALQGRDDADLTPEATLYDEEGRVIVAFFLSERLSGMRIELVPVSSRGSIESSNP